MNATEIIPGLFMGGELLPIMPHNFDAVMDCRWEVEDYALPLTRPIKFFLWFPFVDAPELPSDQRLDFAVAAVQDWVSMGMRTLVHCAEGHNRSDLVVGCFLKQHGLTGEEAVDLIQKRRPGALTNDTFRQKILAY